MQDTKKVAGELLVELEKKGVTFETVDGKLKYKDSKGNFTENSKEKVKKYKEEMLDAAKNLQFERAAELRDIISDLEKN